MKSVQQMLRLLIEKCASFVFGNNDYHVSERRVGYVVSKTRSFIRKCFFDIRMVSVKHILRENQTKDVNASIYFRRT